MTTKKASKSARRRKAREESRVRQALGYTKAQWDAVRVKRRRTAADDMDSRLQSTTATFISLASAAHLAMDLRLGRMIGKAALTERDRGALELMTMIIDEAEQPGVLIDRLTETVRADMGVGPAAAGADQREEGTE